MKRRDSLSLHPAPPSRTDNDDEAMTDNVMMRMSFMMMAICNSKKIKNSYY
jgi:hypothetical protein